MVRFTGMFTNCCVAACGAASLERLQGCSTWSLPWCYTSPLSWCAHHKQTHYGSAPCTSDSDSDSLYMGDFAELYRSSMRETVSRSDWFSLTASPRAVAMW
eukprot:364822-Chlamydomonas_euryale.AAC.14